MTHSIVLIGAGGQLASDLAPRLAGEVVPLPHRELDITDAAAVERNLSDLRPGLVVNTAGYNLVDRAEDEPDAAFAVNAQGVCHVARACGAIGAPLVHVSTDYVFGGDAGRARPYAEEDLPQPLSVYGASKLAGEEFVRAECPRHFIVRTCGLYGLAATRAKGNFVETMLRLSETRPELRVVNDQRCTPSFTADVAEAIAALVPTAAYGTYHATNAGATTWYDLAAELFRLTNRGVRLVPISSVEFGARARRPAYSVLNCDKLARATGRPLPDWRDALARYVALRGARLASQARPET